jgi:CRP-like cAMP-binding protein
MLTASSFIRSKSSQAAVRPVLYDCILSGDLALEVTKRSKPVVLQADRVLFREGDEPNGVYFLRKGNVTLTMHSADRVVMCAHAEVGSLLGLPSTFGDKP